MIYIDAGDLHSTWCNSAALEELNVQNMSNPPGGKIHRDEKGRPSGLLGDAAGLVIVFPFLATVTSFEDKVAALREAGKAYTRAD